MIYTDLQNLQWLILDRSVKLKGLGCIGRLIQHAGYGELYLRRIPDNSDALWFETI